MQAIFQTSRLSSKSLMAQKFNHIFAAERSVINFGDQSEINVGNQFFYRDLKSSVYYGLTL